MSTGAPGSSVGVDQIPTASVFLEPTRSISPLYRAPSASDEPGLTSRMAFTYTSPTPMTTISLDSA